MRVAVVSNSASGRGQAFRSGERACEAMRRVGLEVIELGLDDGWGDSVLGLRAVVAVGGDGTVRAVAGRLAGGDVPMAIVPAGTENLAAKAFGFLVEPERLAGCIAAGAIRRVDLGVIRRAGLPEHMFVVMASAGFDADVVGALHAARQGPISHASYLAPIGATAWRWRAPEVTVARASGRQAMRRTGGLVIANAPEYALRLNPARWADPSDGLLDAVSLDCRSAAGVAGWLARLALAGPGESASMGRDRGWRLRWDRPVCLQADGDPVPGGPSVEADVAVLPGALPLVDTSVRPMA